MSDWDQVSGKMDSAVDARLSDTVSYSPNGDGGDPFVDIPAFVLPFTEGLNLGELDPTLGTRWRIKVAKDVVPEVLRRQHYRHHKLGAATWRPSGENPEEQGRYWIFDIQKV